MPSDQSPSTFYTNSSIIERYYQGDVSLDAVADAHNEATALRVFLLHRSIQRDVPEPVLYGELPSDDEFYD